MYMGAKHLGLSNWPYDFTKQFKGDKNRFLL